MDQERMARTESAFREVNEAIAETAERFEAEEADFVCECADPQCAHRVTAALEDYEEVRAEPTHFAVVPEHEQPEIETVIRRFPNYFVVEKREPDAEEVARETDPRA